MDRGDKGPMEFASEIGKVMSSQQIVLTSCPSTAKMKFDLEYLTQQSVFSPDELVEASREFAILFSYS